MSEETAGTEGAESTASEAKAGYKTTEFWMSFVAVIMSFLYASGLIVEGGMADKAIAVGAMVLTSLGYTVSRTITKKGS